MDMNTARHQQKLSWVADALIPADLTLGMPSASQLGVPERLLPRVFKARPDLLAPFWDALEKLPDTAPPEALETVMTGLSADEFYLVSHTISGAYFLDEEINRKLKYPGQEALDYEPDYEEIMDVVQRVIDRGPIFVVP